MLSEVGVPILANSTPAAFNAPSTVTSLAWNTTPMFSENNSLMMSCSPKLVDAQIEMGSHRPFVSLKPSEKGQRFLPTDVALAAYFSSRSWCLGLVAVPATNLRLPLACSAFHDG